MSTNGPQEKMALSVNSPEGLLGTITAMCKFVPANSVVVVGADFGGQVIFLLRYDLPSSPESEQHAFIARNAASVLFANEAASAFVVGYGPSPIVTAAVEQVHEAVLRAQVNFAGSLRVEGDRYWNGTAGCPPDGVAFNPRAVITGAANAETFTSREAMAASIAPVEGEEAASMERSTRAARRRAGRLSSDGDMRRVRTSGLRAVHGAIHRYRHDRAPLSHGEAAWLALSLHSLRVRDDAWARMDADHCEAHLRLWTDLTRLARPGDVAPAASLLAFCAWQGGDGALANLALDRAQADDPDYSMADLLRTAIDMGAPPSVARLPLTPQQVAEAYDKLDSQRGE